jgi:hypothetical protein
MKRTKRRPFWESISLEELAKRQAVRPVQNLDELVKLWPVDDDAEELLGFVLSERRARRRRQRINR